jgi:hypothetical protein
MARTLITGVPASSVAARTQQTVNTEGVVESVEDIIELISPYETPFFSQIEKGGVNDAIHYWQEDELAAPKRTGTIQGWEPVAAAAWETSTPGMKSNYVQLFLRTARVAGTMRRVQTYGRGDELDYQIMKRGRELRRDVEATMLGAQVAVPPLAATGANAAFPQDPTGGQAAVMDGAPNLIHTSCQSVGTGGTWTGEAGGNASGVRLSVNANGANRALNESIFLNAQKLTYNAGGNPTQAIMSAYHASVVANFAYVDPTAATGNRIRQIKDDTQIINVVDLYKSPYGTVAVVIDRFIQGALADDTQHEGIILLVDPEMWKIGVLRPMQSEKLAKTGDNDKAMLTAEYTLIHKNTKAGACIRDLNTA